MRKVFTDAWANILKEYPKLEKYETETVNRVKHGWYEVVCMAVGEPTAKFLTVKDNCFVKYQQEIIEATLDELPTAFLSEWSGLPKDVIEIVFAACRDKTAFSHALADIIKGQEKFAEICRAVVARRAVPELFGSCDGHDLALEGQEVQIYRVNAE